MIKKIVCAALTMAVLLTSAVGVFAAEYTTSTQYATESGKIIVTSKVDGVAVGDQLTYLAYEGAEPTDQNIAYIDQVTVAASDLTDTDVYTFTYVTDDDYIGATVKQGGIISGSAAAVNSGEIPTVPVVGCTIKVNGTIAATVTTAPAADTYMDVAYDGVPASVKVGDDEVEGWYATTTGFAIPGTYWDEGELALTVTNATPATTVTLDGVKGYEDYKAAVVTVAGDADKFGVIFTDDVNYENVVEIDGENIDAAGKAVKFVALGKGSDGKFMITVSGEFEVGSKFYAKAFADGLTSGDYKEVTVKAAE